MSDKEAGAREPAEDPEHAQRRQRRAPGSRASSSPAATVLVVGALVYWLATRNKVSYG